MRFGLNTLLVSSGFTDAEMSLIKEFRSYGADVIEFAVVEPALVTPSRLNEALKANDLERPIVCGCFGDGRDLRGSEEEFEATKAYVSELIKFAVEVDSGIVCGPFYSRVGRCARHTPSEREAQTAQLVSGLRPLCKEAEDAGVLLAMEPLNRFETDCVNTLQQAVDLIEAVGSPALKIHIDTFHMHIEEDDSAAAILKAGSHIGHVHASASHRGVPGRDQVDWQGVLAALKQIEYGGDIVVESFSEDNEVIARAAAIWRPLYESPEQLSVEGLRFLRETWQLVNEFTVETVISPE